MKKLRLPDEKMNRKGKKLEEKELDKKYIERKNTDEDDGTNETILSPVTSVYKKINEKIKAKKKREEYHYYVEAEAKEKDKNADTIKTSVETLQKIGRILKKKSKTNRMTKSIVDQLNLNNNFLTVAMVNVIDYMHNPGNTRKEILQRQKAIAAEYKKIYNDKSKMKYDKETFWQMMMALSASTGMITSLEPQLSGEKIIRLRRKK